ncbi:MAG: J domain-containing protein [Myxococcales bacterium]|nr:J domain-containing protein [Myxococcales bacterium]
MNLAQAYRILQLRYGSQRPDVVTAFRRLALAMHPDHATLAGVTPADANAAFIELRRAYEMIAAAGFPLAKAPPPPVAAITAKPTLQPTTPNVSTWTDANERLRRQDAEERAAAARAQAAARAGAAANTNEDSERCVFVWLDISTSP